MNSVRVFGLVAGALILAACGGSSSGSFDRGGPPSLSMSAESTQVPANPQGFAPDPNKDYTIQVNVTFRNPNGTAVSDGTQVSLSSSHSSRGIVSPIDDPAATGSSAQSPTSGGVASFWFTSGSQTGEVTLTASGQTGGDTATATMTITVVESDDATGRLSVSGAQTMPTNPQGVGIFLGSPFINELTVRYTGQDGNAGQVTDGQISVAVSPVTRGAFSTLNDPETDENEFFILMGSGPVNMTAGVTTLFIHSFDRPGPLTVSISAQDAVTGENFSTDFVIEIEDGAADFLPSQLDFSISPDPVYVQGAGGTTSKQISLHVRDSGGNPVPNPEGHGASYNNVRLELDAPEGSGARLTGTGAEGSVSGSEIRVRTVNGIANFALNAGTKTGSHRIIATVDRADNNVDNELVDPTSAQTTVVVGDGRLASLTLVSPVMDSIRENLTTFNVVPDFDIGFDPDTGAPLPPAPDGTYSLTVTALGTDVAGNPVLPGTQINFGKIDAPLTEPPPWMFVFSGTDGNPEEGGKLFSVLDPGESFTDDPGAVDEAVEPGDTLAMFGKQVPGNREHEAVRTVESVVDATTITVTEPFNPNDGSGNIVDDGHVIPWVIGRSQVGVIESAANLNAQGRASVQLTYPINQIGRPLVMWGQGYRAEGAGSKTVADVEAAMFPGVGPLVLSATPSSVFGNSTDTIRLCLTDALGAPVNGVQVSGRVSTDNLAGTLDGANMPTSTAAVTGSDGDGCLLTELATSNMLPGDVNGLVTFNVGQAEAEVTVAPPGLAILQVQPATINDPTLQPWTRTVVLTLLDANNNPISGTQLSGTCDGAGGNLEILEGPGVTNTQGQTTANVLIDMAGCSTGDIEGVDTDVPRIGSCAFTTDTGAPEGRVTVVGQDVCSFGGSPGPGGSPNVWELRVTVQDWRDDSASTVARVDSMPPGIDGCTSDGGMECRATFDSEVDWVDLALPQTLGAQSEWSGGCVQNVNNPHTGYVLRMGSLIQCSVTVRDAE